MKILMGRGNRSKQIQILVTVNKNMTMFQLQHKLNLKNCERATIKGQNTSVKSPRKDSKRPLLVKKK